jgi:hypothetical protein
MRIALTFHASSSSAEIEQHFHCSARFRPENRLSLSIPRAALKMEAVVFGIFNINVVVLYLGTQ